MDLVKRGFKDVPEKAPQNYKNAIVMAKALGIVFGYNGNFAWDEVITANEMYLLMLRVLNYSNNTNAAVVGLDKNVYVGTRAKINRGQMYQIIYNTLLAKEARTQKPLQDLLNVKVNDVYAPVLQKIDVYSESKIVLTFNEEIKKISNQDVKITDSKGEEVKKFSISKLDSNVFQIKSSEFVYNERYYVEIMNIEDLSGNLTSVSASFRGIKKNYTDFKIVSIDVLFGNEIRIRFNKNIDKYSLSNDSIEIKDLGIKEVEVSDNYMKIITGPMTKNKTYELNFKSIKDWAGNGLKIKKYIVKSSSKHEYQNVYKILDVKSIGKNAIKVIYEYEVDKDFVEDIKNYKVDNGLKINSAKLLSDNHTVILNTSDQDNVYYALQIKNKVEASSSYYSRHTFKGMKKDSSNSYLYITSLDVRTNKEIEVKFSRPVDIESIMDTDNIYIDGLDILSVEPVYHGIIISDYHKVFRIKTSKQRLTTIIK